MKAYEIFQKLPDVRAADIISTVRELEPNSYKATLLTLAQHKRLRPVFVQKKPRPEQVAWMRKGLCLRTEEQLAEHMVQIYLMKKCPDMLVIFLDAIGIEHDGEGMVEGDLPEVLEAEKVKSGVDAIFDKFEAPDAALYLHVFQMQSPEGWPEIGKVLAEDERAQL